MTIGIYTVYGASMPRRWASDETWATVCSYELHMNEARLHFVVARQRRFNAVDLVRGLGLTRLSSSAPSYYTKQVTKTCQRANVTYHSYRGVSSVAS